MRAAADLKRHNNCVAIEVGLKEVAEQWQQQFEGERLGRILNRDLYNRKHIYDDRFNFKV